MFRRVRNDDPAALAAKKHLAKSNNAEAEARLNKRLDGEIEQLLNSFGEIIQASRVHNRDINSILAGMRPPRRRRNPRAESAQNTDDRDDGMGDDEDEYVDGSEDEDENEGEDNGEEAAGPNATTAGVTSNGSSSRMEPTKDKYVVAQEAYSAQTRAATMVRSVENLLAMVADIKRAYLVNDTATLTAMADKRRRALESRAQATRSEIEELGAALDTAVRELETVYYNSKFVK
ncbi:hypothetical protein IW140_001323 [Coemansia sp. RSA 1813]|nr:hypothetical protein EV178_000967 [Coemansia sp. RSA 1646]KAJ1769124.1 hypothetical protein LPJ74_004295 [Coemansia sp. RSA 1843]KAJ2091923.1 hypothetical protein IW138_001612 [Coemansia sp. RSA 986]KAJ2212452.1 hypothetical protein EV179_004634 [Coemansia sp. RSA 487]KAJ2571682.1 hypothetical protein IW140_001323 [Coemansia sp. RSA 1813]